MPPSPSRQVRVYTKRIGAKPDFESPVVLTRDRGGTQVDSLCAQVGGGGGAHMAFFRKGGASWGEVSVSRSGGKEGMWAGKVRSWARAVLCITA